MMIKTLAYHADNLLGEVEIFPTCTETELMMMSMREKGGIRINQFSQPSDRCTPLAVLHTISSTGVCFKMEEPYKSPSSSSFPGCPETPLFALHSACLREKKTAVMSLGEEELHLVAMRSRRYDGKTPCFWGYIVPIGLYKHCLVMLNLRCLGIVFDLDETLIVANTMRSFEDRIDALQRKINLEVDQQRTAGMIAEVKRYQDDKAILKQYAENDQVTEDGKVLRVQSEAVPALSDSHQPVVRPIIRLQDKNIVLTRINPLIRDTSVLVRLRPAWEELRSYLIAKGRKRFEVYVCTMAERDYALEMWRLLDPDSNLINSNELLNRIVCVKSGLKKSLFNVFHDGICHPKMALVIDDRLKVWDERDQPRVHVVPAFAPYYAPQAEANNTIPVLCVARNVACSVRGSFFKEFDDGLLQRISDVLYEDDHRDIPSTPDVSNYLVSEDDPGTKEMLSHDGMADAEVERRLKEALSASSVVPLSAPPTVANLELASSLQFPISPPITVSQPAPQGSMMPFVTNPFPQASPLIRPLGPIGAVDLNLQSSPAREEGEVPESELDPDTRRRLLILQHGLDIRDQPPSEPQFPVRPPVPAPVPVPVPVPIAHAPSRGNWFSREDQVSPGQLNRTLPASESMSAEKQRPPPPPPFMRKMESNIRPERTFFPKQRFAREVPRRDDVLRSNYSPHNDHAFRGEDIVSGRSFSGNKDFEAQPIRSSFSFKDNESEPGRSSSSNKDLETEAGKETSYSETPAGALHDIAIKCGTRVEFKHAMVSVIELKFSVEVYFAGERVGEGTGKTKREAKHKASEAALMNLAEKYFTHLKSDPSLAEGDVNKALNADDNVFTSDSSLHGNQASMGEESGSPRAFQAMPNKRFKSDFSRVLHRLPSSRYPKNASPVP